MTRYLKESKEPPYILKDIFMLNLSLPTRAQIKFGTADCLTCSAEFTKHRHGQKFCSEECGNKARAKRAGRVSDNPRHLARQKRLDRASAPLGRPQAELRSRVIDLTEAGESVTRGTEGASTGKPCKQPELHNENNVLRGAKSGSSLLKRTDFPVDLMGGRFRTSKQPFATKLLQKVIEVEGPRLVALAEEAA